MRNTTSESLAEHSAQTAMLAHTLALIGNRHYKRSYNADRAATLALFHDACEVYTGDMPTPVKYFDAAMREHYSKIEEAAKEKLLSNLPEEFRGVYGEIFDGTAQGDEELLPLVKAADKLCAYIKCVEEQKSGNNEFDTAKKALGKVIDTMNCPELAWFMDNLLEGFGKTIDELQGEQDELS